MGNKLQQYNMMFFAFAVPLLALYAPLAMSPAFIIMAIYPTYIFIKNGNFKTIWSNSDVNKVIIIALIYSLISALWAINPKETISMCLRMFLFFIGLLGLIAYSEKIANKEKILNCLLLGIAVSVILANIEILTNGLLNKTLRTLFLEPNPLKPHRDDYLVDLNRGASVLSVISWAAICYLYSKEKLKYANILFIAILLTIIRLDSFSTVLGFIIGGIVFTIVFYKGKKLLKIFAILAVVGVFTFAGAAKIMDANELVGNVPVVPGAASNIRLYIWDYAAEQAYKKPIFGWGFNSSRNYPVLESDYVDGGRSPLPLHPHNNTLQVWLELGAVGLVMFAAFLSLTLLRIAETSSGAYIMAIYTSLFVNYFVIGQTGYGIWQNWWVASGLIAASLLKLNTTSKR